MNPSSIRYWGVLVVSLLLLVRSSEEVGVSKSNIDAGLTNLAKIVNQIGLRLYSEIAGDGNTLFSPFSLSSLFGMLYLGARGPQSQVIGEKLGFEGTDFVGKDVHETFKELAVLLADNSLYVANGVFPQSGMKILDSYRIKLGQYYDGKLTELDFANDLDEATNYINQWVSQKTRNKIPELFSGNSLGGAIMVILNVIYFKESWAFKFNPINTIPATFVNLNGQEVIVPMMTQKAKFLYGFNSDLMIHVLDIPYTGNKTSMLLVLAEDNVDLSLVERRLNPEFLNRLSKELEDTLVHLFLPRFKLSLKYEDNELKRALSAMGLREFFSLDYSGIGEDRGLTLSDIVHKAVLEVNEEGTEAAAVSGAVFRGVPIVRVNHPFLFFIRDRRTGLVLFMGRVNNMPSP
ncbi:intracellular coagulation inhibitor 1-like isoform X2 [Tachypleus tridentatus]|uniref:intracellular coagulation inhibitor 1-like isoform X2 n=1 Tax=Tachypleus tridentatus TaxID=6853 RepID=UPI003FD0BECD